MLQLKIIRGIPLNCSDSGVLYHYTNSMDNLESIVENGLQTSVYPNSNHEEPLIGISFSRTKTTIPYQGNDTQTIGYDVDEHGDSYKRWVYGLIFSKRLLSNLGKIRPYNWATDAGRRLDYRIKKIDTDKEQLPTDWIPDTIKIGIISQWSTGNPLTTAVKVYIDYPEDTVDWDDTYYTDQDELLLENKSYLPHSTNLDSRSEYDQLIEPLTKLGLSQSTPIDDESRVVTLFTGVVDLSKLDSYPKTIRSIIADALAEIKPKMQRRRYHQRKEKTPDVIKVQLTGCEPFYLKDQGDTSYETLTKDLQELAKISPDLHLDGNSEAGWYIHGKLPEGATFKQLPLSIQKMLSAFGLDISNESEDRLLITGAKPKEYIPETRKAIIGIIVPRTEYYSDDVDAFRQRHPDIPVYAYKANNEEAPITKQIPKEAYRNPIA